MAGSHTAAIPTASVPFGTTAIRMTLPAVALAPLGLVTPIGESPTLLIHRVLPGESPDLIAAHFDTSVEAIQIINYYLRSPLLVYVALVIPLGQTQTAGLPRFEAYQEAFCSKSGVDIVQLRKYNLLPEGITLVVGRWLLLPRPAK